MKIKQENYFSPVFFCYIFNVQEIINNELKIDMYIRQTMVLFIEGEVISNGKLQLRLTQGHLDT